MPLPKLPVVSLNDENHRRRARETINQVLDHSFDDSRRTSDAEKSDGREPVNKAFEPGDVRRYGAVGDGVTDDTSAIQWACDVAGVGGKVTFPSNYVYLCSSTITIPDFQKWIGTYYELGAGPSTACIRSTQTSGTCFSVGEAASFENLRFKGVMGYDTSDGTTSTSTAVCMVLDGGVVLKDVVFQTHYHCVETHSTYYMSVRGGEANRCAVLVSMRDADVFNLTLDNFKASYCNSITYSNDTPSRVVHNLKVIGGSYELWPSGLFNSIGSASFFGTYFETAFDGAFGFNSDSTFTNAIHLSMFGCLVFLNHLNRFVNFSGLTGGTFVSIGNNIAGSENTGENQYYFVPMSSGGRVVMMGDTLDDRGNGGGFYGSYVSSANNITSQMIVWPLGDSRAGQTWVPGGSPVHQTATTTELVAIGNAINTSGKFTGKTVRNTTSNKLVIAQGSTAGSTWISVDGATTHTPV